MVLINIINWLMIIIASIDVFVDAKKYYKINKIFVDYIIKQYPYRITLIILFLIKSLIFQI